MSSFGKNESSSRTAEAFRSGKNTIEQPLFTGRFLYFKVLPTRALPNSHKGSSFTTLYQQAGVFSEVCISRRTGFAGTAPFQKNLTAQIFRDALKVVHFTKDFTTVCQIIYERLAH